MKRIMIFIMLFAVFLIILSITAYASGNDSSVMITVVIPQTEPPPPVVPQRPEKQVYPVNVKENHGDGKREIIRTYELKSGEKPEDIPRESFTREGWLYELADITRRETTNTDTRNYTETVKIETATNDTAEILRRLESTVNYRSNDGYTGVLQLDIFSIKVEPAGTRSSSFAVSATREYPHLSSNDTSLIPKTITDNGRTLTLSNIDWRVQNTATIDYVQIPDNYTAVATYTGTGSHTVITGYITAAEYSGRISKTLAGKTVYTAHFIGVPIVNTAENMPIETEPETTTETVMAVTEEMAEEQPAEPVTILEAQTAIEAESITETTVVFETETEHTTENTTETVIAETESNTTENKFSQFSMVSAILAVVCAVSGGFLLLCLQLFKKYKKREVLFDEDEETID